MNKFDDNRGSLFVRDITGNEYNQILISTNKNKFTFRGMHFQSSPEQTKIIRVLQGKIIDFVFDPFTHELKVYEVGTDSKEIFVEEHEFHGYLTLEPNTIVLYLVTGLYNPDTEKSIPWDSINSIKYTVAGITKGKKITISDKDKNGK